MTNKKKSNCGRPAGRIKTAKYVLQNRYYKYFNSFSHKNLAKKRWEVW